MHFTKLISAREKVFALFPRNRKRVLQFIPGSLRFLLILSNLNLKVSEN